MSQIIMYCCDICKKELELNDNLHELDLYFDNLFFLQC